MLLTIMTEHEQGGKNDKVEDSWVKVEYNQPLLQNINISSDLNEIWPRATQVWNCGTIGFSPNVIWNKFIFTYELFLGEPMW